MHRKRSTTRIFRALRRKQTYASLFRMAISCKKPIDTIYKFITGGGGNNYPHIVHVKTNSGLYKAILFCPDDIQTLSEVFCRRDYVSSRGSKVFVDIGANIGLSSAFLLCEYEGSVSYAYEPVPENIAKLKQNLSSFGNRIHINECAVGTSNGTAHFSTEVTGRYGALSSGETHGAGYTTIEVKVRDINDVLAEVLSEHEAIDMLKIDIEGLEQAVIRHINPTYHSRIHRIIYEPNRGTLPQSIYPSQTGLDGLF